jgi:hypothetical protein
VPALLLRVLAGLTGGAKGFGGAVNALKMLTSPHAAIGAFGLDKIVGLLGVGPLVDAINPNNTMRRGQITGQAHEEGLASYFNGFKTGLNPTDRISQRLAQEIEVGVRQQGFHGHDANRAVGASAKLVNDLGIDYNTAIELVTQNMRHGTETTKDFVQQMKDLREITKDTGLSITNITKNFQEFVNENTRVGGRNSATFSGDYYHSVEKTFKGISALGGKGNEGAFAKFFTGQGKYLTALGGGNPLLANSKQGLKFTIAGLQSLLTSVLAGKPPGLGLDAYVTMLINSGDAEQMFPGLNHDQIYALLSKGKSGTLIAQFQSNFNKLQNARQQRHAAAQAKKILNNGTAATSKVQGFKHIQATTYQDTLDKLVQHWQSVNPGQQMPPDVRAGLEREAQATAQQKYSATYTQGYGHAARDAEMKGVSQLNQYLKAHGVSQKVRDSITAPLAKAAGTIFFPAAEAKAERQLVDVNVVFKGAAANFFTTAGITTSQNLHAKNNGRRSSRTTGGNPH